MEAKLNITCHSEEEIQRVIKLCEENKISIMAKATRRIESKEIEARTEAILECIPDEGEISSGDLFQKCIAIKGNVFNFRTFGRDIIKLSNMQKITRRVILGGANGRTSMISIKK